MQLRIAQYNDNINGFYCQPLMLPKSFKLR